MRPTSKTPSVRYLSALGLAIAALTLSPAMSSAEGLAPLGKPRSGRSVGKASVAGGYTVKVGGKTLPGVRVSDLSAGVEVIEYQDGDDLHLHKRAGRTRNDDVTLSGTGRIPSKLLTWFKAVKIGNYTRENVDVQVNGSSGSKHRLMGAFPSKLTFNPAKNRWQMMLAVEQIKFFQ